MWLDGFLFPFCFDIDYHAHLILHMSVGRYALHTSLEYIAVAQLEEFAQLMILLARDKSEFVLAIVDRHRIGIEPILLLTH